MNDTREILRRGLGDYEEPTDGYERVLGRRDRRRRNQRIASAAVGIGALVIVALMFVRILNSEPKPAIPTWSGGWVVYSVPDPAPGSNLVPRADATALYAVRPGETPRLLVAGDGVQHVCPSFSSDGSMLAYGERRIDGEDGATAVVVASFEDGRLAEPLRRFGGFQGVGVQPCAEWSHDGWLAMLDEAGALQVVDPGGAVNAIRGGPPLPDRCCLGVHESSSIKFEWSPDGTRIAVASQNEILIVPRSGGSPELVALPASARLSSVAWSPDGSTLLVGGRGSRLWWISMDGPEHEITDVPLGSAGEDDIFQVLWSPHSEEAVVVAIGARHGYAVMTIDSRVGAREITAELPWVQSSVVLSPDGTRLLFVGPGRSFSGLPALMAVQVGGGKLFRYPGTTGVVSDQYPVALAWQPVPSGGS